MEIQEIFARFGIGPALDVRQIYKSAWDLDDAYILKRNTDKAQLEKSIKISRLLLEEGIPAPQYLQTPDGADWVAADGFYYALMKKIHGHTFDPFTGVPRENGVLLGEVLADIHTALGRIEKKLACYEADSIKELTGWITKEIQEKNTEMPEEILEYCRSFSSVYHKLPRQLIHRDMHLGNLLFADGVFVGYLDFDISQINVRVFDLCYMGASMLVENYTDDARLHTWREIFAGLLFGHQKKHPLTEDEREAVPYLFVLIEVTFAAFFSQIGQTELSKSCVEMTKWLFENKEKIPR